MNPELVCRLRRTAGLACCYRDAWAAEGPAEKKRLNLYICKYLCLEDLTL